MGKRGCPNLAVGTVLSIFCFVIVIKIRVIGLQFRNLIVPGYKYGSPNNKRNKFRFFFKINLIKKIIQLIKISNDKYFTTAESKSVLCIL